MKLDICGLGNALMDVLVRLESEEVLLEHGLNKGTMHLVDEERWQAIFSSVESLDHKAHPGGSCANVICTGALLGAKSAFCGQVGLDGFGAKYASAIESYCGEHHLHLKEGVATGKCLSLITPDAERTMVTTLGCAIDLEPEHLFRDAILKSRYLHLTAYLFTGGRMGDTARAALDLARDHKVRVSFDVADSWVVETFRDITMEIIEKYASVVFVNADEARVLFGTSPEEAARKLSALCEIGIIKLGKQGSLICRGEELVRVEPVLVDAMDTTGAGDSYAGAFLYGMAKEMPLEACGQVASCVAAEAVTQTGAVVTDSKRLRSILKGTC